MSLYYVIGSGPAGVACATALLKQGVQVVMLDAGITLEVSRAKIVAQLKESAPAAWDTRLMAVLKENMNSSVKGIPRKYVYGSNFPYREAEQHLHCQYDAIDLLPSLARGGFSNVWGAAVLPYTDADMAGWPINNIQLAEHYPAALEITGLAAELDDLEKIFPLFINQQGKINLSQQASILLNNLTKHHDALQERGIYFGRSRLAVQPPRGNKEGCFYCGMCMYGCPYGFIYNSADTVEKLCGHPAFTYQPDVIVQRLTENADSVCIEGYQRITEEPLYVEAKRIYLAAGVIPTTRILLESLGAYNHTLWIKDSQYFLLPLLLTSGTKAVRQQALHTLSQLFIEIKDEKISPYTVHLQVYSYNDLIGKTVQKSLGLLGNIDFLVRAFEGRLMIIQGYLHSAHSSRISATLIPGKPSQLMLRAEVNKNTRIIIRKVIAKLLRQALCFKAVPVPLLLQVAQPGRGFHSGGSFPMQAEPGPFESDLLGRPTGFKCVHLVDATVFPTIPATTITLSVMANAHRIAWESAFI